MAEKHPYLICIRVISYVRKINPKVCLYKTVLRLLKQLMRYAYLTTELLKILKPFSHDNPSILHVQLDYFMFFPAIIMHSYT